MEGKVDIKEFMKYFIEYLEKNDLVITERRLIDIAHHRKKQQAKFHDLLRKKFISLKDIKETGIWGNLSKQAIYNLAKRKTNEGELVNMPNGNKEVLKVLRHAVARISIERGILRTVD